MIPSRCVDCDEDCSTCPFFSQLITFYDEGNSVDQRYEKAHHFNCEVCGGSDV